MLQLQRLALVWSATIFFLTVSPLLIIYALGYQFDTNANTLKNAITISSETGPDRAKISSFGTFGEITNYSNGDFRIVSPDKFKMEISKEGFVTDSFNIKGKDGTNSLARVKKVNLLPEKPEILASFSENQTNINFVSNDYFIYFDKNLTNGKDIWKLQQYGYSGLLGEAKEITSFTRATPEVIDLDLAPNFEYNPNLIKTSLVWEVLSKDVFWQKESKIILFKDGNSWKFLSPDSLGLGETDFVWLKNKNLILRSKTDSGNLYSYNLQTDNLTYLTDNIEAISFNNEKLWFVYQSQIYTLQENAIESSENLQNLKPSFNLTDLKGLAKENLKAATLDFKVISIYQGLLLKLNNQIFYKPDSETKNWAMVANDVQVWTPAWHSIFWIDQDKNIHNYNLELEYQRIISHIPSEINLENIANLHYYPDWHRIFVYIKTGDIDSYQAKNSKISIRSFWFNPNFINEEIKSFNMINWVSEAASCQNTIEGGYQFCINPKNELVAWRNLY